MTVKRFTGKDYRETLLSVKHAMGKNAVILHTRSFKAGGVFGLWGSKMVEITATDEMMIRKRGKSVNEPKNLSRVVPRGYADAAALVNSGEKPFSDPKINELAVEVRSVKQMVAQLISGARVGDCRDMPEALQKIYVSMLDADVPSEIADTLARAVNSRLTADQSRNHSTVETTLNLELARRISVCGPTTITPGAGRIIALIGPTGVGKTTTIAKLAAIYKFQNLDVGLITLDSYRIAAVEQLRTYAGILDFPLQEARTPEEFTNAIQNFRDKDVVLIDTAGRSQRNVFKMGELRSFLDAGRPDEIHLVASATTTRRGLKEVIERFGALSSGQLILTKVDEASGMGATLEHLLEGDLKVSYITTGQRVPDDIESADSARLARLCLGVNTVNV